MIKKLVLEWLAERGVFAWEYRNDDDVVVGLLWDDTRFFIQCAQDVSEVPLERLRHIAELVKRGTIAFVAEHIDDVQRHLDGKMEAA